MFDPDSEVAVLSVQEPPVDVLAPYKSGSLEPWTCDVLCALVKAQKPHILVETGTFEGMTTRALFDAQNTYANYHGSLLTSIEFDEDRCRQVADGVNNWRGYQGVGVQILHGEALAFIQSLQENSVDFAFVDDDHSASHVHREITSLLPKMRPGGLIAMHDVVGPFGLDAVCRAFGGVVLDFARLHTAGGLGLITVPA